MYQSSVTLHFTAYNPCYVFMPCISGYQACTPIM